MSIFKGDFRAAQLAWDYASPEEGPELPEEYPTCKWCEEPTGSHWKQWNGVKRPSDENEDFCMECFEVYACAACETLALEVKGSETGLCATCTEKSMSIDHTPTEQIARETLAGLWAQIGDLTDRENDGNRAAWEMAEDKIREAEQVIQVVLNAINARTLRPVPTQRPA